MSNTISNLTDALAEMKQELVKEMEKNYDNLLVKYQVIKKKLFRKFIFKIRLWKTPSKPKLIVAKNMIGTMARHFLNASFISARK